MVIVGSSLIIFGAELNTPFTIVEVFRKILRKEANDWDTSALISSLVGTMINLLVTFASRLVLAPIWRDVVLKWGPLLSGCAVACDYYGSMIELGFLFGSYELREEAWLNERRAWEEGQVDHPESTTVQVGQEEEQVDYPQARIADFRRVLGRLNGDRANLNKKRLEVELAKDHLSLPPRTTLGRWLKKARTGG
jgi:hypothetical protein